MRYGTSNFNFNIKIIFLQEFDFKKLYKEHKLLVLNNPIYKNSLIKKTDLF